MEKVMASNALAHADLHAYPKMAEPALAYGSPVLLGVLVLVERLDQ